MGSMLVWIHQPAKRAPPKFLAASIALMMETMGLNASNAIKTSLSLPTSARFAMQLSLHVIIAINLWLI
jgi:hypothetical protein